MLPSIEQSRREAEEAQAAADRKNQIERQRQELDAKMKAQFEVQDREHQEIIEEQVIVVVFIYYLLCLLYNNCG